KRSSLPSERGCSAAFWSSSGLRLCCHSLTGCSSRPSALALRFHEGIAVPLRLLGRPSDARPKMIGVGGPLSPSALSTLSTGRSVPGASWRCSALAPLGPLQHDDRRTAPYSLPEGISFKV